MIGHWIKKPGQRCSGRYCSVCDNHEPYERNFCPECGTIIVDTENNISPMTNADLIRAMSDEEMEFQAKIILDIGYNNWLRCKIKSAVRRFEEGV